MLERLAHWLGLTTDRPNDDPSSATRTAAAPLQPSSAGPSSSAESGLNPVAIETPYRDLFISLDVHLAELMSTLVIPHRHHEPADVFNLTRIEVTAQDAAAAASLDRFLKEFRPDSRRKMVLAVITRTCPVGVSTRNFIDFNKDFDPVTLQAEDPYSAAIDAPRGGSYRLKLFGDWLPEESHSGGDAPRIVETSPLPVPLEVSVSDEQGQRQVVIHKLPYGLGREPASPAAPLMGRFLSRRHGVIEQDQNGVVWYRDTSVNGTWLDGQPMASGSKQQLRNGSRLQLGGTSVPAHECPMLTIIGGVPSTKLGATPLRNAAPAGSAASVSTPLRTDAKPASATPLTGQKQAHPQQLTALCLISVQDAQGSRTVPVFTLPFLIGRGEKANCCIPEANLGVSREHLLITTIHAQGADVVNHGAAAGRWGTQLQGVEQSDAFLLPWDGVVLLAPRYAQAPPVTLKLLQSPG